MLYETLKEPYIFLITFAVGIIAGFLFDAENLLVFLCNGKKTVKIILDFIIGLCIFICLYLCLLILNYGELRFYIVLAYFLGVILQRLLISKPFTKLVRLCYNKFEAKRKAFFERRRNTEEK